MRWLVVACLSVACGGSASAITPSYVEPSEDTPSPRAPDSLTPAEISARALPSVVVVTADSRQSAGFVVGTMRIATSLHGIRGSDAIRVRTAQGVDLPVQWIVSYDERNDLAILAVKGLVAPPLALGVFDEVQPGDAVTVLGHPMGLEASVSVGVVAGIRAFTDGVQLLQVTAAISPGSSGGPILNDRGEVVGVTRLLLKDGQALNFGASVAALERLLYATRPSVALRQFAQQTSVFEKPVPPKELGPPRRGGKRPFPDSVIGFKFGSGPKDAGGVCGEQYTFHPPDNPNYLWCRYVPTRPDGVPGDSEVLLSFATGKLVEVTFEVDFRFSELLTERYGAAAESYTMDGSRVVRGAKLKDGDPGGMLFYLDQGNIGFYRIRTGYVVSYVSDLKSEIQSQAY